AAPYFATGWNPLAHAVGGLMFGVGMAITGNCGFGALARLGGGDLRAFVIVLVMGISAYVVMSGPLAHLRLLLFPPDLIGFGTSAGYAQLLSQTLGTPLATTGAAIGVIVLALVLASRDFRAQVAMIAWGAVVGGAIAYGWAASSALAEFTFGASSVQAYSFAEPLGESILYAMTSTGTTATFAVGAVGGVWVGAFAGSLYKGHFRWEACEDPRELRRQIFGSMLMGGGAVIALGCSVGQGLSGISVLAYGAPLTLLGILAGASMGLRSLIAGFHSV
ncbi:MAG: YeeE/YedE family protein, partial [Pseudomonadota bacterium]